MNASSPLTTVAIFALACAIGFGLHIGVLHFFEFPLFEHRIVTAYIGHWLLASATVIGLLRLPKRLESSMGFIFLGASFFKFIFFFVFFYPIFKIDGEIDRIEFSSFFIPYAICLIMEVKLLISKLSN